MWKLFKRIIKLCFLIIFLAFVVAGINVYMVATNILDVSDSYDDAIALKPECVMVLGASVEEDGSPSEALKARLDTGIRLYKAGVAPKLLLSGDNGQVEYDEVSAMKAYALDNGVPEEDIFMDHAGFSTYDSIYRADYIFCVSRMVVVSQKDHLYRVLYGCKKMGIDAQGFPAEGKDVYSSYYGSKYNIREYLARAKDFVKWIIRPEPKYLGDKIPIDGDGRQTEGTTEKETEATE